MKEMNIVMSSDNNYAQNMGIAILSILDNKNPDYKIIFHILDGGIFEDNKIKLHLIVSQKNECQLNFIKIDKSFFKDFHEKRHLKISSYYRLLAPTIISANRILYLDSDIIVTKDLLSLYFTDLKGHMIAASRERSCEYVKKYFFRPITNYFNAGVLLIDTKKWIEQDIWHKVIAFNNDRENERKIKYADQDILNHLLEDDWLELEKSYNFQLDKHQSYDANNLAHIFHFVGSLKPWHYLYNNRYKELYIKYLKISPWSKYKYSDYNFKNIVKKRISKLLFLSRKKIQKYIPKKITLNIKNVSLYFNNRRDSR